LFSVLVSRVSWAAIPQIRRTEEVRMRFLNGWKRVQAVLILVAASAMSAQAQTFSTLLDFDVDSGALPFYGPLAQGQDGNIYGTTYVSRDGGGTVFKLTKGGALTTLDTFDGPNGYNPEVGLVLDNNGIFYGATVVGGNDNFGTVFEIGPKGKLNSLYSFTFGIGEPGWIEAGLAIGDDGDLYGTSYRGGTDDLGTVFKLTPRGALTTLYSFSGRDGEHPSAQLIEASDGDFYGAATLGGKNNPTCGNGCGTIFKITRAGKLTTIYKFNLVDGFGPRPLMQANDGNLYGTTTAGGIVNSNCPIGCGTVFKVDTAGTLTTLFSFSGPDGASPYMGLYQATDGNFYGATEAGGGGPCSDYVPNGCGTIFQITPAGVLTVLHRFDLADGAEPTSSLFQATNGILYGTTEWGGSNHCITYAYCGTVYSLDMGLASFVAFVRSYGKVGQEGGILGQGLTGTTSVSLNGIPASFTVVSDTYITATVPAGAATGYVTVTTPTGTLTSNVPFHVLK
jgi:uncharacterized repeat protein (TIGR03803 family)